MSRLQDFLNGNSIDMTAEVVISERIKDESDRPMTFKIKAMNYEEYDEAVKKATVSSKVNTRVLSSKIIIENTIDPNFRDAEYIAGRGCSSPEEYLASVLLPGEISELANQIARLSGFGSGQAFRERVERAKN